MTALESVAFPNVVARAQLTTATTRPCTYYAGTSQESRVFVKGPYPSKDAALVATLVTAYKKAVCARLPSVAIELRELLPDGMPDCQFGLRKLVDRTKPHWFQVARDVFALEGVAELPTTTKTSAKAWPNPVKCVDWKELESEKVGRDLQPRAFGSIPYEREYAKSIYALDPEAAKQLVMHVLLSWSCGCGADLANRNFLYFPAASKVYQVDLEAWDRMDWDLRDAGICSDRCEKGPQMRRFVDENWTGYFERELDQCRFGAELALPALLADRPNGRDETQRIIQRLKTLCNRESVMEMLPASKKTKRKERSALDDLPEKAEKKGRIDDRPRDGTETNDADADEGGEETEDGSKPDGIFVGRAIALHNHSSDPWGNPIDVAKSNFQKCVRRGIVRGAMYSFFAVYNLETIYPDSTTAKALRTNIVNRLIVCVAEDIGVANVPLLKKTLEVALPMSLRETPRNPAVLGALVYLAATSKKCRIQSHLYHAYAPENAAFSKELGLDAAPADPAALDLAKPNCFSLVGKNDDALWRAIESARPGIAPLLKRAYTKASALNKRAFLQCALAVTHFSLIDGKAAAIVKRGLVEGIPDKKVKASIMDHLLLNKFVLVPIPEAYDKHTRAGRGSSSTRKFREEGALVTNPHEAFADARLERIYKESKK